ncbi:IDEAL domain-containing protein [Domibacillus sp. A3M-37]|uniref:IDEAL domain-containing protein n=1 Tax=Domibacillus sp. A3M-37 TaxID=2962037 RepID=UPI0020B70CA3|nr:IDEAL domain-containing protein [Domibacillus sp. A3M-37]MCP3764070.1 IDEAL domain-containing protein [Domibacillus sp. A3M-37]
MLRIGDWRKVKIGGCLEAIGYVSNIMQHGFHGEQVELIKVVYVIGGEPQIKDPLRDIYSPVELEPAGDFWDKLQDRSALIDLALLTKDEQWFEELTGGKLKWPIVEQ